MNNKKWILNICIFIYVCSWIVALFSNWDSGIGMTVVSAITPLIVPFFYKLLGIAPIIEIDIINVCFVYFASLIGSCLGGYGWQGFDKVVHFFSGIIMTVVGMLIYTMIKKESCPHTKEDKHLYLVFIMAINMTIAVFWEFFEYAMLVFFNNDCINHFTSGVHDSITDMLCAFGGGCIVVFLVGYALKKKKSNFFFDLTKTFKNNFIEM